MSETWRERADDYAEYIDLLEREGQEDQQHISDLQAENLILREAIARAPHAGNDLACIFGCTCWKKQVAEALSKIGEKK